MKLTWILCLFSLFCGSAVADAEQLIVADQELRDTITAEIESDLQTPLVSNLMGRKCLNGQPVPNFEGQIIEYWVSLDCPYCTIEGVQAIQAANASACVVVRHYATEDSAIQKSMAYEALAAQSLPAAQEFWTLVLPKHGQDKNVEQAQKEIADSLQTLMAKYALDNDFFASTAYQTTTNQLNQDRLDSMNKISFTPTFVIDGIRLSACDLKQNEFVEISTLITNAKKGDIPAKKALIEFLVKEQKEE